MTVSGIRHRTWAEIDLDSALYNFNQIKASTKAKLCCVIKANAYGHGALKLAELYESAGGDFLAVSNISEALQLRRGGIKLPILILGYTDAGCAEVLAKNNISQTVYSPEYGKSLAREAKKAGVKLKIHIKIDSGMGRIGFTPCEIQAALDVCREACFLCEGVFTHFAAADEGQDGEAYTKAQFEAFLTAAELLKKNISENIICHCANSAAIFDYPEYHLDMVRAGVVLYGLQPSGVLRNKPSLKPVMTLKSVVSHIKEIDAGTSVSYGRVFRADRKMRIATVPIGYADGFWRNNYTEPYSLNIGGKPAPIKGRVCMDQLMVDIGGIECAVGDTVTVFGTAQGNTADDIARINHTINYEVVCAVGERVPRAFIKNNEIVAWKDDILGE